MNIPCSGPSEGGGGAVGIGIWARAGTFRLGRLSEIIEAEVPQVHTCSVVGNRQEGVLWCHKFGTLCVEVEQMVC